MKRLLVGSLLAVVACVSGCVVVPGRPPRAVYVAPAVVVPAPVVAVGVYGYRR